MSEPYAELLQGATVVRRAPGLRHETICRRLHELVRAGSSNVLTTRVLPPRTEVFLSKWNAFRPDLAMVVTTTGKLWLAAEIISSDDHHADTVIKKQLYEEERLPRLWVIDPRYNNVEVYQSTGHGLVLRQILAGREVLSEKLLPEFQVTIADLFRD